MVVKLPGKPESLVQVLTECPYADSLRRIVAGVQDIDPEFECIERGVMHALARDKCVEARLGRRLDPSACGARDDADPCGGFWSTRDQVNPRVE